MAENRKFDVLIIGAGPAGFSAAISLADSGLSIAIIEKNAFPKTKTCGDGLTLDVVNQLFLISPGLGEAFMNFPLKFPVFETRMFSPDFSNIGIPSIYKGEPKPMFTCKRVDFDHFLFQYASQSENIHVFQNTKALDVIERNDGITVHSELSDFEGKILLFSDGANSLSSKLPGRNRIKQEHLTLGLRAYYKGIQPLNEKNPIEIYFLKETLPGYLWIFPLGSGEANVGLGMPLTVMKNKKNSIREKFHELLESGPFKKRLENAVCTELPKGHLLPMSGRREHISGNRFLILGDAAGLVDPFSGEGVGNAIRSGRVAAEHIKRCFRENQFDSIINSAYDREIYKRLGKELANGRLLLKLSKSETLVNFLIFAVSKNDKQVKAFQQAMYQYSVNSTAKGLKLMLTLLYLITFKNLFTKNQLLNK